jgi:hypothetical protein
MEIMVSVLLFFSILWNRKFCEIFHAKFTLEKTDSSKTKFDYFVLKKGVNVFFPLNYLAK